MGKKQNRKSHFNKIKQSIEDIDANYIELDDDDDDNLNEYKAGEEASGFTVSDAAIILNKIKDDNEKEREKAVYLIASANFENISDKNYKDYISSPFLKALVDCYLKSSIAVKMNTVASIINILTTTPTENSYLLQKPEDILIKENSILQVLQKSIQDIIKELATNKDLSDVNTSKACKLFGFIIELLSLLSEVVVIKSDEPNIFCGIISNLCEIVSQHNKFMHPFPQSLVLSIISTISELLSLKAINVENNIQVLEYAQTLETYVTNSITTSDLNSVSISLLNSALVSLFYIHSYSTSSSTLGITTCIENLSSNIVKLQSVVKSNIELVNQKLHEAINDDEPADKMEVEVIKQPKLNEDEQRAIVEGLKKLENETEDQLRSLAQSLKLLSDIILIYEDKSKIVNIDKQQINEEEWEEISDDSQDETEQQVSVKLAACFPSENTFLEKVLVENKSSCGTIISPLLQLSNISSTSCIIAADSTHSLAIEDLLHEVEYASLSLVSNCLFNFQGYFKSTHINILKDITEFVKLKLASIVTQQLSLSKSSEFSGSNILALLLTLLRNIINIDPLTKEEIDIQTIFQLYNKNKWNKEIKTTLIDLIGRIFHGRTNISIEANQTVCNYLLELFEHEKSDVEVLCHVFNSFMDVYAVDEYNDVLAKSGIVQLMINGNVPKNLISQIKAGHSQGILDKDTTDYCKETVSNLKEFIKYKQTRLPLV